MSSPAESFADFGLSPGFSRRSPTSATNPRRRSRPPASRSCSRATTCSVRRRPAPARPPPSRCRLSSDRRRARQAAGAGAGADARTGDPGRRGLPKLRPPPAGLPRAADLRRPELHHPAEAAEARRARHRRHPGPRHGSPRAQDAQPRDLRTLVLDEADEMLRMGFVDDVEWILERTPAKHQMALFSATMPAPIRRIAQHHLRRAARGHDPVGDHDAPPPASSTGWSPACTSSTR